MLNLNARLLSIALDERIKFTLKNGINDSKRNHFCDFSRNRQNSRVFREAELLVFPLSLPSHAKMKILFFVCGYVI